MAQLPSFYAEDTPASANELWSRLHSDPLFAARPAARAALTLHTRRPTGAGVWKSVSQSGGNGIHNYWQRRPGLLSLSCPGALLLAVRPVKV